MSTADLVELIKAIGSALGAIIGAVGLAYARIAAKRAKQASEQTATKQHVDGQLRVRSSAQTAEQTALDVASLKYTVEGRGGLVEQIRQLRSEVGAIPGKGRRRAPTASHPIVKEEPNDPW